MRLAGVLCVVISFIWCIARCGYAPSYEHHVTICSVILALHLHMYVDYFAAILWSFGIINAWIVVLKTLLNN